MPDGEGGGGGEGGEGGGTSEYLPMDDLVDSMLRNSKAMAETLAADRARREAADRIQRESWQAALKEKDAEIESLRSEAADSKSKLQADASRKLRWEAAYDLLLGANLKLAELRDADMEDSRMCAATPNSNEAESCTKLSQITMDHAASDFRKLEQAYETLSSKKDKEVSALLSEKDSLRSQLDIMKQDYAELLNNKKVEAAQATEAGLKLQRSVDELKALAQKNDGEIARLQAEAVGAKKKHDKDLSALLSEKDSLRSQLSVKQKDYTELLKNKKVLTRKQDHEFVILRAKAVDAEKKVQQMQSLAKEKDNEIQRLKGLLSGSAQKHHSDISETHKRSRSGDPDVTARDKLRNTNLRQSSEEDYMSESKTVEKDGKEETTQKRGRASSMPNDDQKSGSNEDDDEQIGSEEDGGKQTGSGEDGDNTSFYPPKPLRCRRVVISHGRRRYIRNGSWGQYVSDVNDSLADEPYRRKHFDLFLWPLKQGYGISGQRTRAMKDVLDGHSELLRRLNEFLPNDYQIEVKEKQLRRPGVPQTNEKLPSGSASASTAARPMKLNKAEQQPKREQPVISYFRRSGGRGCGRGRLPTC